MSAEKAMTGGSVRSVGEIEVCVLATSVAPRRTLGIHDRQRMLQ
jgi:hypothetical protein